MAKRIVNLDIDPTPQPPEDDSNLGMFVLTVINVCAAVFLLYNSVAPPIWGEVIAPFEIEWKRTNLKALGQRTADAYESDRIIANAEQQYDRYNRFRWLHWIVTAACVVPVIGLLRISFGTYLGDFSLKMTTVWLALTFVLTAINYWPLGWGGTASFVIMGTVALEAALIHNPTVQRLLSGAPEETAEESETADGSKKKKKKTKEADADEADESADEGGNGKAKSTNPDEEDYSY